MNDAPEETNARDYRVREFTQLRLTLREDLQFTPHFESGEACYIVEDDTQSRYFRIGITEYLFISMFDGKITIGDALQRLSQLEGDHALSEPEATIICKWLVDTELATTPESTKTERLSEVAGRFQSAKNMGRLNPVCVRVPFSYPDRFFQKVTPLLQYAFGRVAAAVGIIAVLFALQNVTYAWDAFMLSAQGITSPSRWLWLLVVWVVLKIVHETAHGVVCRKHGGSVHEAGAVFILFMPLAYVDLTSSWRFRSRWHRIQTAAAGMYIEIWLAAVAAIMWASTAPGLLNDLCFNVVIMAGVTTLVFNANPLMRFDGYYILSDWLEIPNLYSRGNQYLMSLGRSWILGESTPAQLDWSRRDCIIRIYGIAAFIWRIFICFWIVVGAAMMFHGFGILLAVFALAMWLGFPMLDLWGYIRRDDGSSGQRTRRFFLASTGCVAMTVGVLCLLPWPGAHRARAIVQYEPLAIARAESPGFVKEIFVTTGQQVKKGQPIAQLENRQLLSELDDLKLAIQISQLKARVFKQTDEIYSYQAEMEQLASLQSKWEEKQQQVDSLLIRAEADGRLIARNLELHLGTYLEVGDEIAAVGNESQKELRVAIPQQDFKYFQTQVGQPINARITGGVVLDSKVDRVVPRANNYAPHESMYGANGGPLPSRANPDAETDAEKHVLLNPHFTGVVSLSTQQSRELFVGQQGVVWFGHGARSMGEALWTMIRQSLPEPLLRQYSSLTQQLSLARPIHPTLVK